MHQIRQVLPWMLALPVLLISTFVVRRKNYISFGEWFGKSSSDSAFYIFKVASADINYNVAWITKSYRIRNHVLMQGYTCYHAYSIKGIFHQLRSWTFVSTVNSRDFYPIALVGPKNYIQLGHGLPMKKFFHQRLSKFAKFKFLIRSKLVENYSYYAVTSSAFIDITKFQYRVNNSSLLRIPSARLDYFMENDADYVRNKYGLSSQSGIIIAYLPTHRDEGKTIDTLLENLREINEIVRCESTDVTVLFKPHHYDIEKFRVLSLKFSNIRFCPEWDTNDIMLISDLFIGDYSGIVFDYFYLNKYEIGFCPDYDSYIEKNRDLYFNLEDIYENLAKTSSELHDFIHSFVKNGALKINNKKSFFINERDSNVSNSFLAWDRLKSTLNC